jgi:hypothetical protein
MKSLLTLSFIGVFLVSCQETVTVKSKHVPSENKEIITTKNTFQHNIQNTDSLKLNNLFNSIETEQLFSIIDHNTTDSSFRLYFENDSQEFISNRDLEQDSVSFDFHGFNSESNVYILERNYWEGHKFLLINKSSQIQFSIWNMPIFSPNHRKLVCKSDSPGYAWTPNGYQLWELDSSNEWTKTKEINQDVWTPIEIRWIDNENFLIKTVKVQEYLNDPSLKKVQYEYQKIPIK